MPEWKTAESYQKLLAAMVAAQEMKVCTKSSSFHVSFAPYLVHVNGLFIQVLTGNAPNAQS